MVQGFKEALGLTLLSLPRGRHRACREAPSLATSSQPGHLQKGLCGPRRQAVRDTQPPSGPEASSLSKPHMLVKTFDSTGSQHQQHPIPRHCFSSVNSTTNIPAYSDMNGTRKPLPTCLLDRLIIRQMSRLLRCGQALGVDPTVPPGRTLAGGGKIKSNSKPEAMKP